MKPNTHTPHRRHDDDAELDIGNVVTVAIKAEDMKIYQEIIKLIKTILNSLFFFLTFCRDYNYSNHSQLSLRIDV